MNQALPHSVEAEQGVLGSILISPLQAMPQSAKRQKAGKLAFHAQQL
jgi:replicative DNA helicase